MKSSNLRPQGQLVADFLAGSWRAKQTPLDISPGDLERITTLLYNSGSAGLAWWRIRETGLRDTPSGELLHQAFRLLALQANIHQTKIQEIFQLMRAEGVEPILLKGWAIARLYPQPALRPYGDIDLLVCPRDFGAANHVIESEAASGCWVDLHTRLSELADSSAEDLFARSELVLCGHEQVRVLGAEDHFALLAIHLLKHGAWRPSWLCDLGLLLESMSDDFDWNLCLGNSKRQANWILSAVGLAHALVDAQIRNEEIGARSRKLPARLAPTVLRHWEAPFAIDQPPMSYRAPMSSYLRRPRGFLRDLSRRWPDPILATISINGQFNRLPRFPYQVGNIAARALKFLWRLPQTGS